MMDTVYASEYADFAKYHVSAISVAGHAFCTMVGVAGALRLARRVLKYALPSDELAGLAFHASIIMYVVFLKRAMASTEALLFSATLIWILIVWCISAPAAALSKRTVTKDVILITLGYFGQDLIHFCVGEATFQSTYSNDGTAHFLGSLAQHTLFLLPFVAQRGIEIAQTVPAFSYGLCAFGLLVCAWAIDEAGYFSWCMPYDVPHDRTFYAKIDDDEQLKRLDSIGEWWWRTIGANAKDFTTWHAWLRPKVLSNQPVLPKEASDAFDAIVEESVLPSFRKAFPASRVGRVHPMDEIYVSRPEARNFKSSSDDVFIVNHIDGPFYALPFTSVYRVLVCVRGDPDVSTHFPQNRHPDEKRTLAKGDVLGFDFNREIHYIDKTPSGSSTLKSTDFGGARILL